MTKPQLIPNSDTAKYDQRYPLHALIRDWSSDTVLDDDAWLKRFSTALEAGVDVNEVCSDGFHVWELINYAPTVSFCRVSHAMVLMVKAGFNPLIQKRDYRLNDPCSVLSYFFLGTDMDTAEAAIGMGALYGLGVREAQGTPFLSPSGGNALHGLAQEVPHALIDILECYGSLQGLPRLNLPTSWLTELDNNQHSVLSLLWSKESVDANFEQDKIPSQREGTLQDFSRATHLIIEQAPCLLESSVSGDPVWQAINKCRQRFCEHAEWIPDALSASLDPFRLEKDTIDPQHSKQRLRRI